VTDTLKECPFCGGDAFQNGNLAECESCGADHYLNEWNRRASNAALPSGELVTVPKEAYLWLMGLGKDAFTEDRQGAFWWRSAFNERAGLDMMAIWNPKVGTQPEGGES
jgi:hypothetical protein